jgi:hypothetical protein
MFTQAHTYAPTQTMTVWCDSLAKLPEAAMGAISFVILAEDCEGNRPGRSDTLLPEVPRT